MSVLDKKIEEFPIVNDERIIEDIDGDIADDIREFLHELDSSDTEDAIGKVDVKIFSIIDDHAWVLYTFEVTQKRYGRYTPATRDEPADIDVEYEEQVCDDELSAEGITGDMTVRDVLMAMYTEANRTDGHGDWIRDLTIELEPDEPDYDDIDD